MAAYEKMGAFYLGRVHDPDTGETKPDLLLYDSKDLTTHAVCVGMTGSGKTGLCVGLIEEAAIDGIPAIVIDPKGDLGNLMLNFPLLRPEDFAPWVDAGEASRKGLTPDQFAVATAEKWRKGLQDWGQSGQRIRRLKSSADFTIYTPASNAGRQLTVMRSFAAPPPALLDDADAMRERINAAVAGLLALLGIDADPVRSREHILISSILGHAWRDGRDLDIAGLIMAIQSPPFDRIGVMDLEAVYPAKDRFELSMTLNNLLASPGFAAWMEGEALDVSRLLWTEEGKPRIAILSIAHLSEAERMFFVTILLNEVVAWMRTQPGTSSLRALLYMDEVFGYFPPTQNPPSKRPMLTLLKQARAYGLGCVLATQNPVDLDYKGLSNAGTWFLGRLQTERDKARVLDGLEGASATTGAAFDRQKTEQILSGLKSRTFLLNNVHDDGPELFQTRWAMSYLRGPLTRAQIRTLMQDKPATASTPAAPAPPQPQRVVEQVPEEETPEPRPVVPADVPEFFMPVRTRPGRDAKLVYRPALLGTAELHYANARLDVDSWQKKACLTPLKEGQTGNVWEGAAALPSAPDLTSRAEPDAAFAPLPRPAARAKSYTSWSSRFKTHLYKEFPVTLYKCRKPKLVSELDETERDFRIRLQNAARELRDMEVEKLRRKYAPKLERMQDRIRRAQDKVERETEQYSEQKASTAISVGSTILGALFGRKVASVGTVGRAATTARRARRASKEKEDIARAKRQLTELNRKLKDLEADFQRDLAEKADRFDPEDVVVDEVKISPRKTDTTIGQVALVWTPWWVDGNGIAEPAA